MPRLPGIFSRRAGPIWAALLLFAGPAPAGRAAPSKEYQIKAVFLFNFAQFVLWPPGTFPDAAAPLRIGVLGDDPFGSALDHAVAGEKVRNHQLIVVRSRRPQDLAGCQLVFISQSEKDGLGQILARLGAKPILTVSEIPGFAELGGMINFYLKGNRVRFEINPQAARREKLRVSSQLLGLGTIVEGHAAGKGS